MNFISNVLVPTDLSEASIDALNYSIKIVRYSSIPVLTLKHESHKSFPKPDYDYDFHKWY